MTEEQIGWPRGPHAGFSWDSQRREIVDALALQRPRYTGIALRYVSNLDDAEDAWQRALLRALEKMPPMEMAEAERWFCVVLKNEARDVRRGLKMDREASLVADTQQLDKGRPIGAPRSSNDPLDSASLSESLRESALAYRNLASGQRMALDALSRGLSYKQIADAFGWSYTKVNRLINEGRVAFRQQKTPVIQG